MLEKSNEHVIDRGGAWLTVDKLENVEIPLSKPDTSSITGTRLYSEAMLVEPEAAECFARCRSLAKPLT